MKTVKLLATAFLGLLAYFGANAQLNVGSTAPPNGSAVLQVSSTTKGFLPPVMAKAQMNAISAPATGLMVYCTDCTPAGPNYYNGTAWTTLGNTIASASFTSSTINCGGALAGTYQQGIAMGTGNTKTVTITVTTAGSYTATTDVQDGVTFSASGTLLSTGAGVSVTLGASGTPLAGGTFIYTVSLGGQTCTFNVTYLASATIACGSAVQTITPAGALANGTSYTGSYSIPYTAGNGLAYASTTQTLNGLTLTSTAGTYAAGGGNIVYTLSGTYTGSSAAQTFTTAEGCSTAFGCQNDISVGSGTIAQMMYDNTGSGTASYSWCARTVTGPDGLAWLDRNLGAYQVATSSTDVQGYGSLYQWGRNTDGHQIAGGTRGVDATTAATTVSTQATTDVPGNNKFITASSDWRSDNNNNRWNSVTGSGASLVQQNNPCPSGYHVPTSLQQVTLATATRWTGAASAYSSTLKMPMAGWRYYSDGSLGYVGSYGYYWSSTPSSANAYFLTFGSGSITPDNNSYRAYGFAVRCLKN